MHEQRRKTNGPGGQRLSALLKSLCRKKIELANVRSGDEDVP
jgi:hypothetical protein